MKLPIIAVFACLVTLAAACGDSDDASTPVPGTESTLVPGTDSGEEKWQRLPGNVPVVSGEVSTPDNSITDPDDPNMLLVRFIGGDPNCTAATVELVGQDDETIDVRLVVGITEDALTRSCVAGEFNLELALDVGQPVGDRLITFATT